MAGDAQKPNIIFILADDLGWGDLGAYGHPHIKTPKLDQLAAQGTLFTQFYVNAPVCSPSRSAFMTGQYPARNRIHGAFSTRDRNQSRGMPNWLDPQVPTITRLLKNAGYSTAHFGKWHLGRGADSPSPSEYGIDRHRTIRANGPNFDNRDTPYFRARSTGLMVDEAIHFIEEQRDRPFYINLWTLVPHAQLHPTDAQMEPYRRFGPTRVPYRGANQIYYATVTAMDADLGRLFSKLDELGLTDNTIVLFASDNGPEDIHLRNASHSAAGTPGPFRGRKRSLYEGGIRQPFIARWPGHIPAARVDSGAILTAVDLLPTLLKLAGVALPEDDALDGEDVSDILLGQTRPRHRPIFWEWRFGISGHPIHHSPMLAVRDGDWKLLMNPDHGRTELYDIAADPMELDNRAAQHTDIVDQLAQELLDWQHTLPPGPHSSSAGAVHFTWPKNAPRPQLNPKRP